MGVKETIKTFGLKYDDFPTMVKNVALLLWILTIDIYKKSKPISMIFYIMTSIAGFGYFYVYTVSMIWMVFFYYGRRGEVTAVCVAVALSSCSVICVTKFVFMKLYAKEIKETVYKFLQCDSHVVPDTRFAKNLRKNLRIIKRRATLIWVTLVVDGIIYMLIPFMTPGRHFTEDLYLIYGLVPMNEPPNYEIALFLTTVTTGFGVYTMSTVAVYVIIVVGYTEAQMHALSTELRNVWEDSHIFYDKMKDNIRDKMHAIDIKDKIKNEFTKIRLRDITKFHITNIELSHELDQQFRPTLALECSIMAFSIIAELLGGIEHTYLQFPFSLIHASMDCLAGQRLVDAGDDFENALYCCKWENFNIENQKTILLMLRMSQKTLMLSAGGIANLNFNFLMIILKSTYSTYTTLKTMYLFPRTMWKTVKKFGLDYDDFPTILDNVALMLRSITIDIYKKSKPISPFFYFVTSTAAFCFFYVFPISTAWMVFYYGRIGNWTAICVVVAITSCSITCVTKFIFMKIYNKKIKKIVENFLECDSQVKPNTRFANNLRKNLRIVKKRATIIWTTLMTDAAVFIMIPFIIPGRHFTIDLFLIYGLVPMFEWPNYEIALFLTSYSVGFGMYAMLSIVVFVIVVVGYIESQIHALSEELRNIWNDSQIFYNNIKHRIHNKVKAVDVRNKILNGFIRDRLSDIIKFHVANTNLLHKLDQNFRSIFALECVIIAFSIITELLGGLENTYLQLPFSLVHIFMDCFAGQRLIDAGNDYENALYSCEWENFNIENQKTILLMLKMSQKTLMLSAGGITKLDYTCFMMILKSTYSAYATLKTTVN